MNLNLIIKQKYFDQILSGEKRKEYREIRPKTAPRYCEFTPDGSELVGPKHYDTLTLFVGYAATRPTMVIEVKNSTIEVLEDEDGNLITFVENGKEYAEAAVVYDLGKIIETRNISTN